MKSPRILSLRGFAKRVGVSTAAIYHHLRKGHILSTKREVFGIHERELAKLAKYRKLSTRKNLTTQ